MKPEDIKEGMLVAIRGEASAETMRIIRDCTSGDGMVLLHCDGLDSECHYVHAFRLIPAPEHSKLGDVVDTRGMREATGVPPLPCQGLDNTLKELDASLAGADGTKARYQAQATAEARTPLEEVKTDEQAKLWLGEPVVFEHFSEYWLGYIVGFHRVTTGPWLVHSKALEERGKGHGGVAFELPVGQRCESPCGHWYCGTGNANTLTPLPEFKGDYSKVIGLKPGDMFVCKGWQGRKAGEPIARRAMAMKRASKSLPSWTMDEAGGIKPITEAELKAVKDAVKRAASRPMPASHCISTRTVVVKDDPTKLPATPLRRFPKRITCPACGRMVDGGMHYCATERGETWLGCDQCFAEVLRKAGAFKHPISDKDLKAVKKQRAIDELRELAHDDKPIEARPRGGDWEPEEVDPFDEFKRGFRPV